MIPNLPANFYAALPRPLYNAIAGNPIFSTQREYIPSIPSYYLSIAQDLYNLIPSKDISNLEEINLFIKEIDTILHKHNFSRNQFNEQHSILKEEDFLKYALHPKNNAEQNYDFSKIANNTSKQFQWELATSIAEDLTLSNIIANTSAALGKNRFLNPIEIKTILIIMCHALDFFDPKILLNAYKNIEKISSHYEDLKSSPQNIALKINEKFQIFFKFELNSEGIFKAEKKLKDPKAYSKLKASQIKYLNDILSESKIFYIKSILNDIDSKNINNDYIKNEFYHNLAKLGAKLNIADSIMYALIKASYKDYTPKNNETLIY